MAEPDRSLAASLHRLMAWLSPSFPVGAFSYSHGLEWAVETGDVATRADLLDWLAVVVGHGSGLIDACVLTRAHALFGANDRAGFADLNDLAVALQPSRERRLETTAQGDAFLRAARDAWPAPGLDRQGALVPVAYPVAVGSVAAAHGVPVDLARDAYLHAFSANLISAAVRLVPLGQTDGQRALAAMEPVIVETSARARGLDVEAAGGCAFRSDIASMRHETQYTRLFRT